MLRNVELSDISDGSLYDINSLVKLGSNGCDGCHKCCQNMDGLIVLDPYDVYNICRATAENFQEINGKYIEAGLVDGIVMPHLKFEKGNCVFLDECGRCAIHSHRPSICRMFPLGRVFDNNEHKYILQTGECNRAAAKVKIKKWLEYDNISQYEKYTDRWHYFIKDISNIVSGYEDRDMAAKVCMYILNTFYVKPYGEDFFGEFYERVEFIENSVR